MVSYEQEAIRSYMSLLFLSLFLESSPTNSNKHGIEALPALPWQAYRVITEAEHHLIRHPEADSE